MAMKWSYFSSSVAEIILYYEAIDDSDIIEMCVKLENEMLMKAYTVKLLESWSSLWLRNKAIGVIKWNALFNIYLNTINEMVILMKWLFKWLW